MKRKLGIALILSACLSLVFTPVTSNAAGNEIRSVCLRGAAYSAPENTLPAFALSAQEGFTFVEADVSFTSDGVPVLLHDPIINRTARNTDGSQIKKGEIYISDITYKDAQKYDFGIWRGAAYAGTKLPKFEEFLDLCKQYSIYPYINITDYTIHERTQIEALVDMVERRKMGKLVTWVSFNDTYLTYVRDKNINARLGLMATASDGEERDVVERAKALRTASNKVFLDLSSESVTNVMVNICRNNDMPIEVWGIYYADQLNTLHPYVSGVTTDELMYVNARAIN